MRPFNTYKSLILQNVGVPVEIRNQKYFIGLKSINNIVTKNTIHTMQTFDIKVYI